MRLPFATGYSVDVALLIDAWRAVGIDALAQVDLDVRQNRHRPLDDLAPMAAAVVAGVLTRVEQDGRLAPGGHPLLERPPLASLAPVAG